MKPRTEELLYFMLWSVDRLMRPTFRNLTDSYETWIYRNGWQRQVAELERRQLLERHQTASDSRVLRLTESGRIHALGGRDPEIQWLRPWDHSWRIVLFDIPTSQNRRRDMLRQYLRSRGFGLLQNSAWVTPDPLVHESGLLSDLESDVRALLLLEGRPCAGETDASIVMSAWDFEEINRRFRLHLQVLEAAPDSSLDSLAAAQTLRCWAAKERAAWLAAMTIDPLLPEALLPNGYLGRRAWLRRRETLRRLAKQLQSFNPAQYEKST